jgi:hypothetical protein
MGQTRSLGAIMDLFDIAKIFCFYVLVASGETLNGIFRTLYLNRRMGIKTAKNVSILSALFLCFFISYFYVPIIGITSDTGLILLGISLSVFMLLFDILLGRFVMKVRWSVIMNDLNIFKGNLLCIGLIVMAVCPLLATILHRKL